MTSYITLRQGLPRLTAKLRQGGSLAAGFLGGSVTEGFGASEPDRTSWRALTECYLKDRFGAERVACVNAGVGGTTSSFGAFRLREHALGGGPLDLVFVEFAINDGDDRAESIRGMEGIVRQCRRLSPGADIVFVYTAADRNIGEVSPPHIAVHEEVAVHYGIPSANLPLPIRERIAAGEFAWRDLAPDGSHPNDAGYAIYAAYVRELLEAALPAAADAMPAEPPAVPDGNLPAPLAHDSYESAEMLDIGAAAIDAIGFVPASELPAPLINWRYDPGHLAADTPGAELVFELECRGAGAVMLCGPDTGAFEYAVDGGAPVRVNLFDEWCLGAYRPVIAMFQGGEERRTRRIAIRLANGKDERSKGTGLRILKLLRH